MPRKLPAGFKPTSLTAFVNFFINLLSSNNLFDLTGSEKCPASLERSDASSSTLERDARRRIDRRQRRLAERRQRRRRRHREEGWRGEFRSYLG